MWYVFGFCLFGADFNVLLPIADNKFKTEYLPDCMIRAEV